MVRNFIKELDVCGSVLVHKKHEILLKSRIRCIFRVSLVELTGDDNSATSTVAVAFNIRMSPKKYVWSSHIGEYIDQSGDVSVVNPARGQLNRENDFFPVPVRD